MVPFVIRPTRSPARAARHVDRLRHHLVIQPAAGRPLAERRRHALRQLLFAWPSARDATAAAVPGSRKLACCPRTPAIPQPCRRELPPRSEEHTSELQSLRHLVCRLLLENKKIHSAATRVQISRPASLVLSLANTRC